MFPSGPDMGDVDEKHRMTMKNTGKNPCQFHKGRESRTVIVHMAHQTTYIHGHRMMPRCDEPEDLEEDLEEGSEEDAYNLFRRRKKTLFLDSSFDILMHEHVDLTVEFIRIAFIPHLRKSPAEAQMALLKQIRDWDLDFKASITRLGGVPDKAASANFRTFRRQINAHIVLVKQYAVAVSKNDMSRAKKAANLMMGSNASQIVDSLTDMVTGLNSNARTVYKKQSLKKNGIRTVIAGGWSLHLTLTIGYINALLIKDDIDTFEKITAKAKSQGLAFGSMLNELVLNRKK